METVKDFTGLASDSREVKPGFLFAALSGSRTNGAEFIEDAVSRGAVAVLAGGEAAATVKALGVRFIEDANPRARLAHFAKAFYREQPAVVAAVTGTNGKTSVTVFLRQIWTKLGKNAASMGTIGVVAPKGERVLAHTTPDPIETHRILAELKREGVDYLALEASSHGLDQHRLDGVDVAAGAFTNITRDHLDYHPTFESYLAAKLRLFAALVRRKGLAVINADADHACEFRAAAEARALSILMVGENGRDLALLDREPNASGQRIDIAFNGQRHRVALPLLGAFPASNALTAAALAIGLGEDAQKVFSVLETLKGAPGRLELVAHARAGAPIFVDYAHTPDALETILKAVRPHTKGKLRLVFGCGGNRDAGKRPMMGRIAAGFADAVIVTDDNPRNEDAAVIRRQILAAAPGAAEIGDRRDAIGTAVAQMMPGDLLVIAGKGHETGQIVGGRVHAFSDREVAIAAAGVRDTAGAAA